MPNQMFSVLYEDNHLLVVNKPAGMLVQGDRTGDMPLAELAKDYIKRKYGKPGAVYLGVVHRLDRPVSGVVVLARTSKALDRMNRLFRERETEKIYYAWVDRAPARHHETLTHWLVKDEQRNKATAYTSEKPGALLSTLSYEVVERHSGQWLLKVCPVTGRPHQIRVQLAAAGCPIAGDVKYGSDRPLENGSIYLHARRLSFFHPVKKEKVTFVAPFPAFGWWTNLGDEF